MDQLRHETLVAADAVRDALELARAGTGAVHPKPGRKRDVVTDADVAVEDLVRSKLEVTFGLPVVGEERGGEGRGGEAYWLVDPICGTRNFASGIPLFAVNVALVEDGALALAVVGDGSNGAVQVAERGAGAFRLEGGHAEPLAASPESEVVDLGFFPAGGPRRDAAAAAFAAVVAADRWDVRTLGTTLGLAYLAAGRIAAYGCFTGSALHFGAGALIASEAGAIVTDLDGAPFGVDATSILACASPGLHVELLALVARAQAQAAAEPI